MAAALCGGGGEEFEGKKQLGRSRLRYEINVKMDLKNSLGWHGRDQSIYIPRQMGGLGGGRNKLLVSVKFWEFLA